MANATSMPLTTGEYVGAGAMALASGTSGQIIELNATTRKFQGLAKSALATQIAALVQAENFTVTLAPNATYDWDSTAQNVFVTHAAAACDVSLPVEASITNWPPLAPPRRLFKMNASANGINLLTGATCTINGAAADANMSPIPDSNSTPSNTVLAQWVYVYRASATSYYVFGGA
jgi:hypothetical protein